MLRRADADDPVKWEDFVKADERDYCDKDNALGQQSGKCMKMADFIIINDTSLQEFKKNIEKVWDIIKAMSRKS